jgi:hypothetical protein
LLRKDAEIFKSEAAAEKRLAELKKNNPRKDFVLVAVQFNVTRGGQRKFNSLPDGPFKLNALNGIFDTTQMGEFNFATRIPVGTGQYCWEWLNHGLNVKGKGKVKLEHKEELPSDHDATVFVIVEKIAWKSR